MTVYTSVRRIPYTQINYKSQNKNYMMLTFLNISVLLLGVYTTTVSGFSTSISYSRVSRIRQTTTKLNANIYDAWNEDLLSSANSEYTYDELILPLDEESIEQCLDELMESDYGKTKKTYKFIITRVWQSFNLTILNFTSHSPQ